MAPHSTTLAWKIPWMEEPGGLQYVGSLRVGHDWATSLSLFTFMQWRRKWQPSPCSCLENPRDGGAWWAAVYGVTQSRTRLKRLSSSSSLSLGYLEGQHTEIYAWIWDSPWTVYSKPQKRGFLAAGEEVRLLCLGTNYIPKGISNQSQMNRLRWNRL